MKVYQPKSLQRHVTV